MSDFENNVNSPTLQNNAISIDRLKSTQTDYKILKDQLKLYEDENRS